MTVTQQRRRHHQLKKAAVRLAEQEARMTYEPELDITDSARVHGKDATGHKAYEQQREPL